MVGNSDGTDALYGVNNDTNTAQELIGLSSGSLQGAIVGVSSSDGINESVTVGIEGTDKVELTSESGVPNVTQTFSFSGPSATLEIDDTVNFSGLIANFVMGETIDLADLGIGFHSLNYDPVARSLTILRLDDQTVTLRFTNSITDFIIRSDGANGANLTTDTPAEQALAAISPLHQQGRQVPRCNLLPMRR